MPKHPKVLVTGASGYIAKHIVLQLLEAGHSVRGSVRSLSRADEVRAAVRPHLPKEFALDSRLEFVALDLEKDDGWDAALAGVDALLHTASPFPLVQPKDPDELVRPAVEGTLRALRAAKAASVRRVVVTGSGVSILNRDSPADRPFDERDWSQPGFKTLTAYGLSKLEAEKAAWQYVEREAPQLQLTVINPGFVVGRPLDRNYGTSLAVIERFLKGRDPMVPDIGFICVDVGDIARVHVCALEESGAIGLRIAGMDRFLTFQEMALAIKERYPQRRIPTRVAPHILIRLLGLFDPALRSIIPALGRREELSNERARTLLGMRFADPRKSIGEAAEFMVENGIA
jgi:dihydroflavonol-4-reductase